MFFFRAETVSYLNLKGSNLLTSHMSVSAKTWATQREQHRNLSLRDSPFGRDMASW